MHYGSGRVDNQTTYVPECIHVLHFEIDFQRSLHEPIREAGFGEYPGASAKLAWPAVSLHSQQTCTPWNEQGPAAG